MIDIGVYLTDEGFGSSWNLLYVLKKSNLLGYVVQCVLAAYLGAANQHNQLFQDIYKYKVDDEPSSIK